MYKIMLVALVVLMLGVGGVLAQDESLCEGNLDEIGETITEFTAPMDEAITDGDVAAWLDSAFALRWYLSAMDAYCRGFAWDSETEGNQPVIGPVRFPDGLYIATVETDGFFALQITEIEGTCEPRRGSSLFNLGSGDGESGASATLETDGCVALLEISNVTESWTLHFELVSDD